jgi:hypothetical protein
MRQFRELPVGPLHPLVGRQEPSNGNDSEDSPPVGVLRVELGVSPSPSSAGTAELLPRSQSAGGNPGLQGTARVFDQAVLLQPLDRRSSRLPPLAWCADCAQEPAHPLVGQNRLPLRTEPLPRVLPLEAPGGVQRERTHACLFLSPERLVFLLPQKRLPGQSARQRTPVIVNRCRCRTVRLGAA